MGSTAPAFGSNNPFRQKPAGDPSFSSPAITTSGSAAAPSSGFLDAASKAATPPPLTSFRTAATDDEHGREHEHEGREDNAPVQLKPKKVVKRVRVQSPPPSSPDDVTPVRPYAPDYQDDDSSLDSADEEHVDPFGSEPAELESSAPDDPPIHSRPPPNPFAKTLQDLGHGAQDMEGQATAGGKGAMDVDSFRRLLLTGQANVPGAAGASPAQPQHPPHDGASITDASSVSRQSVADVIAETPRTSHEISETEESEERRTVVPSSPLAPVHTTSGRKKPPPPSSRHGKLIKLDLGADKKTILEGRRPGSSISIDTSLHGRKSSVQSLSPPSASDVNKPLPLPPTRPSEEEDLDSPFDREAAGKLPESFAALSTGPRTPTPPPAQTRDRSGSQTSTLTTSSAHRKPVAPPPRRSGHARTNSKPSSIYSTTADEDPPRSSLESSRSHADSLRVNISSERNQSAPAPPAPRRPNHARQGSSFTSPTSANVLSFPSPGAGGESRSPGGTPASETPGREGQAKLSPPPPPPTRQPSTRRTNSVNNVDINSVLGTRKPGRGREGGGIAPPPPPRPRTRGGNKSISGVDVFGSGQPGTSGEAEKIGTEKIDAEITDVSAGSTTDIMEQLRALQQEVEAARKASTSG